MDIGFGLYDDKGMATLPHSIAMMGNSFMVSTNQTIAGLFFFYETGGVIV